LQFSLQAASPETFGYTPVILRVVICVCETWFIILWKREEALENKVMRRVFEPKRVGITEK
jgi:hypothetical protein